MKKAASNAWNGAELVPGSDLLKGSTKLVSKIDDVADVAKMADKVDDGAKLFSMSDVNSFKNVNIKDVEKYLDEMLDGYTKVPLKRGNGIRYYDGKGNSWQLNYGYPNATDEIHGGAYLKTTNREGIVRIPLNGDN